MSDISLKSAKKVRCPQCSAPSLFHPSNVYRPFCSERCKMIDLGAWANDEYAVPGKPLESPLSTLAENAETLPTQSRTLQ
ncbi:MAG: DNA gyrase inhibitor YacG [Gammaproteobacteria bacterium]|nr:DNA gyrase inhibitor YacG [Gammaproteobacteria bacterium]